MASPSEMLKAAKARIGDKTTTMADLKEGSAMSIADLNEQKNRMDKEEAKDKNKLKQITPKKKN